MLRLLVLLLVRPDLLLGLALPLVVVLGPPVHLTDLLRRRWMLPPRDRRGRELIGLPYPKTLLRQGLDILLEVVSDRVTLSLLRWWIRLF